MLRCALLAGFLLFAAPGAVRAASLFDDLGGHPGLEAIIGNMIDRAAVDPRISDKFDNINLIRLKRRIVEHVCAVSGGPCSYTGISMKGAHGYLELQDRHFNALVEDLQAAMDQAGVAFRIQNRLLALLAPMHRDIVTK